MSPAAAGRGAGGCAISGGVAACDAAAKAFAAWRDGDPAALDQLVRILTPVLWQLARAYGLDRQAAEDVVQTTWLALVRNSGAVRDPQAIWRWSTTTARREAWRLARSRQPEDPVEPAVLDGLGRPSSGPEAEVLAGDRAARLWQQVGRMSDRCRRLLRVIAFDDRPDYATLSRQLAVPMGSIGPTRGRCLEKLRRLLADDPQWSDP